MPRVTISWTDEDSFDIEAGDYDLSSTELQALIAKKAYDILPGNVTEYELEWDDPIPKVRESQLVPPDDFWHETIAGLVAANTTIVILKGFNLPSNYNLGNDHWRQLKPDIIDKINAILLEYKPDMPRHDGPFWDIYESVLKLKIVGFPESPAYLEENGKLVGIIFPKPK